MLKNVVFFACLLGLTLALPKKLNLGKDTFAALEETAKTLDTLSTRQKVETSNEMCDVIISEVCLLLGDLGFDPFKLPDVHQNFSYKPIIITYHGELDMENGWAQDVSKIYRNGDVQLDYTDRVLTFKVPIKFSKILFNYDYSAKIMSLGPSGGIEGSAADIEIYYVLVLDFNKVQISLEEFDIVKIGHISSKFTGNGLIDWFVNLLSPIVTGIFKGLITIIAEGIVRNSLVAIVDLINELLNNVQPPPSYDLTELRGSIFNQI